jgi:Ribbon-helix-helix protein, copG family
MSSRKQELSPIELQQEMDLEHAVRRPGRPHGVVVSVRLEEEEARQLRDLAKRERRTLSQLVRQAVSSYLSSPTGARRIADVPRTSGGGSAAGQITIRLAGHRLPVGETDMVESVETSAQVSSTVVPVRILVAT